MTLFGDKVFTEVISFSWQRIRLQCGRPGLDSWAGKIHWRRDRIPTPVFLDFPGGLEGKRICLQCGRPGFNAWVGKIPWKRAWQPTPVFLPGESPWTEEPGGLQSMESQSDMTERLSTAQHTYRHRHRNRDRYHFAISLKLT